MKKLFLSILLIPLLLSCNDENRYSIEKNWIDIATVENPSQNLVYSMRLDNGDRLWTIASDLTYYRPKNGQRIIAKYTILSDRSDTATYKHNVRLNDVYEILTKGIFKIKPATQDSIGSDQIEIRDMWIGSDYLNVEFEYPGYNKMHYINLVSDSTKTYADDKIHLEFRHNANNDYPSYSKWGMVSFDLRSLQLHNSLTDSVNLVIHTQEFASPVDKSYALTYKYGILYPMLLIKKIAFPVSATKVH